MKNLKMVVNFCYFNYHILNEKIKNDSKFLLLLSLKGGVLERE